LQGALFEKGAHVVDHLHGSIVIRCPWHISRHRWKHLQANPRGLM